MSNNKSRSLLSMGFVRLPRSSSLEESPAVASGEPEQEDSGSCETRSSHLLSESSSRSCSHSNSSTTNAISVPQKPNQPSEEFLFPKKKFGDNYRSFKSSWTRQFPWLHYNESSDSAFCWYCMKAMETKQLKSSKREDSFITRGFCNWKNATAGFRKHEDSDCHKEALDIHSLPHQCEDIALTMQRSLTDERRANRTMLYLIIRSIKYLARQGLALRGHSSDEGNFIQLLKFQSETDPTLQAWLAKNREKYTSGEIQNEILRLMAHNVLRTISKCVHNNTYYALMADEVTDSSNREQFVICLRWVDRDSLVVNEDLIGFYQVDNITASTLFTTLKDALLRLNISIHNCRAQCFDGASNMVGARSGVATLIQREEPRAILVHCYGHSLQLAVSDTVKKIKTMADALDTTNEISKLIKYSPKRDTLFEKLKQELAPDTPGFRVLCPTRWTVSLYKVSLTTGHLCLSFGRSA